MLYYPPCLNFWYFFFQEKKYREEDIITKVVLYFLCLDAKKVTKKNQERKDIQHFSFIRLD